MESHTNKYVIILEKHDQLRKLAIILRNREGSLMADLESELEQINYLTYVTQAHNKAVSLLAEAESLSIKHEKDGTESKLCIIAKGIEKFIVHSLNWALQCVKNCRMRAFCIDKIKTHFDALVTELEGIQSDGIEALAAKVEMYNYYMWEYGNKSRTPLVLALYKDFSVALEQQGITFSEFINRKKSALGFKGEFEELDNKQKFQVYNNTIINALGGGYFPNTEEIKTGNEDVIADLAALVFDATVLWSEGIMTPSNLNSLEFDARETLDGRAIAFEIVAEAYDLLNK